MAQLGPDEMEITYTTSAADMEEIHAAFDEALEKVRSECGRQYPAYVGGREVRAGRTAFHRLEGLGLQRQGWLWPLLRDAVHARTEPPQHRGEVAPRLSTSHRTIP